MLEFGWNDCHSLPEPAAIESIMRSPRYNCVIFLAATKNMKRFGIAVLIAILGVLSSQAASDLWTLNQQDQDESGTAPTGPTESVLRALPVLSGTPTPTNPLPPLTSPIDDVFKKGYWYLVLLDTKEVFTAPARWDTRDWLMLGGIAAGIGTVAAFDEDLQRFIRHHRSHAVTQIFDGAQPLGNEYAIGIVGAFYLTGEIFKDPRAKATALDSISATAIASGLVATTLKYAIGRARPSNKQGAYDFEPFTSNDSFCSGHTTEAFTLASVISDHYESTWVAFTAYSLAGMVGYARLNNNRHWSSDVLAGAAVGTFVGKTVVRFNKEHRKVSLQPIVGPDMRGAQISVPW